MQNRHTTNLNKIQISYHLLQELVKFLFVIIFFQCHNFLHITQAFMLTLVYCWQSQNISHKIHVLICDHIHHHCIHLAILPLPGGMTHSPAMHSPHLQLRTKTEAAANPSSFTPVSASSQPPPEGSRGHVPTPPRPMSTHTPGMQSQGPGGGAQPPTNNSPLSNSSGSTSLPPLCLRHPHHTI